MSFNLFFHVLAYSFLLSILVLSLVSSRWHWMFKVALVVLVPLASLLDYQTWRQAQGWPTQTKIPERFLLNAAVVEEPDNEQATTGGIFLWLTDLKQNELDNEPRAYRLPYDKKEHIDLQLALRKMRDGKLQIGELKRVTQDSDSSNPNGALGIKTKETIEYRDLPDPALPEK